MTPGGKTAFLHNRYVVQALARPRLLMAVALAVVVYVVMPGSWHVPTRILLAWNLGTWFYVVLAVLMMRQANEDSIRRRALLIDESRFVILALATLAALASLGAIFAQLSAVKDAHGALKGFHVALAASTIVSAWVFIQLIFTQHYAHEFYVERDSEKDLPDEARGGLLFPSTVKPNYMDFAYYSFVIGCASQTADIATTSSPMRLITLLHGILSFFFNTTILALTINIGSGLVS